MQNERKSTQRAQRTQRIMSYLKIIKENPVFVFFLRELRELCGENSQGYIWRGR